MPARRFGLQPRSRSIRVVIVNKEQLMPAERSGPLPSRRSIARSLLLGVASLLLAGASQAQSLLELYTMAQSYDATYLAARALAESATYRAAQADALRRPNVSLASGATRIESEPPSGRRSGNTTSATMTARQPLFNRPNAATIDQAYRALEVAQADLETAEQDLIVRVSQAYFDVLGAQDTLAFTRASKTAITEQLAAAKRNFEVGTATITDTREAQARFDLATAQEIAAENDLRTKRAALDQVVGRASVEPKPLAAPVVLPPLANGDAEQWVGRIGTHPNVRRALLNLDIAKLETDKARAGHLPVVDLVGTLGSTNQRGTAITATGSPPGVTNSASVGLQLSLPLYSGNSVQNRVRETLLLEEKSRNDLEAVQRGAALATRQAFLNVQSGQAQVKAFEAAESSSQLALEATQLGYKVGVRVNLDVLNAQTQLFQTRRDLAKARYDVLVGSLRLRQAAGQLKPADLPLIEQLLAR
jgi:outer membrane protein